MHLHLIARTLLGVFCGLQGIGSTMMDLNRTHATHPQWLGHARFHVVWQTATVAALTIVEIALLCFSGPLASGCFYVVTVLALLPMVGFFAALATRRIYGGTLSDPGGIPPVHFRLSGRQMRVDMNLVVEVAGVLAVMIILGLYRVAGR